MSRQHWSESDDLGRVQRGMFASGAAWVIAIVILIGVISIALWGFGVFTAPAKGRGDAYHQQQSGVNRVFAQQQFHDLYNEYLATVSKLPIYKEQAKTGDTAAQTNLTGLQSHCLDVAAKYNAATGKYLTKDFLDAQLPTHLDPAPCQ